MLAEPELVAAANENFLGSFAKLVEHVPEAALRDESGLFAFTTGLPVALFNGCVVHRPVSTADLADAVAWVRAFDVPYYVWLAEGLRGELIGALRPMGIESDPTTYPNMVLHPVPDPPAPAGDIRVDAECDVEAFVDFSVAVGSRRDLIERIVTRSLAADSEVRPFTGRLDGRPAGTSLAIRTGSVSGVYNVGVAEACRRRGVGTALTWAAVAAGQSWGCDPIVLQSSTMALSMYEEMGFRTVVPYLMFEGGRS